MTGEQRHLKITNPQRIIRIFRKICQSRLHVFLRAGQASSVVVKGRAEELQNFQEEGGNTGLCFYVNEISDKGIKYLFSKNEMQIEFVMTSTKVICTGRVLRIRKGQVILSLPQTLTSVERRGNARYKTTKDVMGFLQLSLWQPRPDDYIGAPYFVHHKRFASMLPIVDIGFGGVCVKSMFPSPALTAGKETRDPRALFFLPMSQAFELPVVFRWVKLIREHMSSIESGPITQNYHLFGCQFQDLNLEGSNNLKKFIQQIIESGAI